MRGISQTAAAISWGLMAWAAISTGGCGGVDTRPATNDDFRSVQAAEAAQNRSLFVARDPGTTCEAACSAVATTCAEASTICDLARETEDLDLRVRCRRAEEKCSEVQSGDLPHRDDCTCSPASP